MYTIFEKLLKEKGLKIADVQRGTGISYSTFTDWKAGRYTPKHDKLQKIADFFGVSVEYLTTGKNETYYINPATAQMAQELFNNPDMRILFDAARNSKPEDLQMAADMLKRFKETNPDG